MARGRRAVAAPARGLALCGLVIASVCSGACGSSTADTTVPVASSDSASTVSSASGGLRLTLAVSPVRATAGQVVSFRVSLGASDAAGALAYRLSYGDGSSHGNIVPQFCRGSPGAPEHATWELTRRYQRAGTYRARVYGHVNCSNASRLAATLSVVVR